MSLSQALTRPVPLRTSAVWQNYQAITPLRVGYGESLRLVPLQYDNSRRWWFLLDHPAAVQSVTRNGEGYGNWAAHNQADATGAPISLLELGDALNDDETLIVTLQGRTDPDSGALITNPAAVLQNLLTDVSGYTLESAYFVEFAAECAAHGITVSGLVDHHQPTLRSTIFELMQSIGAMWSLQSARIARLFPLPASDPDEMIWAEFSGAPTAAGVIDADDFQSNYDETEILTELQIDYDYDWADNVHRQSVVLRTDRDSRERYGRRVGQLDARWLNSPAAADALGERLLKWLGRPLWSVAFNAHGSDITAPARIPPGALIRLGSLARCPLSGDFVVQQNSVDHDTGRAALRIEGAVGREPAIEFVQRSTRGTSVSADYHFTRDGDTAVIVTTPGATVSLNGRQVVAGRDGRAFFPATPPGTYELRISLAGFDEIVIPEIVIP